MPRDSNTRGAFCAFKAPLSVLCSTPLGLGTVRFAGEKTGPQRPQGKELVL